MIENVLRHNATDGYNRSSSHTCANNEIMKNKGGRSLRDIKHRN